MDPISCMGVGVIYQCNIKVKVWVYTLGHLVSIQTVTGNLILLTPWGVLFNYCGRDFASECYVILRKKAVNLGVVHSWLCILG